VGGGGGMDIDLERKQRKPMLVRKQEKSNITVDNVSFKNYASWEWSYFFKIRQLRLSLETDRFLEITQFPMHATYSVHRIYLDLFTLTLLREGNINL
jgi:hypothetical protein